MRIYVDNPSGGFGNRLFQYNLAAQIQYYLGLPPTVYTMKDRLLINNSKLIVKKFNKSKNFYSTRKDFDSDNYDFTSLMNSNIKNLVIENGLLGEYFYKFSFSNPKKLIKIKYKKSKFKFIGIHIRGKDFYKWNKNAIHPTKFYFESIEYIKAKYGEDLRIRIFSDDFNLNSTKQLIEKYKLKSEKSFFYINDFKSLMASEFIISSPSTFAIWAGILGGPKEIIFNYHFVRKMANLEDKFWYNLFRGGNKYFKVKFL